jgi:uncharacterized protein (TIGR04168 family)
MPRIGVVGDVHGQFDEVDARLLDAHGYDLLLFVGDFAGYKQSEALRVARAMRALQTPAIAIPGNHDGVTALQLLSEVLPRAGIARELLSKGQESRCARIARELGAIPCEGYRLHVPRELGLQVLTARPHSCGGPRMAFARYLRDRHRVDSMTASGERMIRQLDDADTSLPLLVLAHNGPTGLGETRESIYGCDFRASEGDFGDLDLRMLLDEAKRRGFVIPAVVAGHMHHALKGGGQRVWAVREGATLHVNAARFPRHRERDGGWWAHHVRLVVEGGMARVEEVVEGRGAGPGSVPPDSLPAP